MTNHMNNIGLAVHFFREQKFPGHGGQKLAAKELGIGKAGWNHYEKSDRLSNLTLEKIAGVLDVSVDDIISKSKELEQEGNTDGEKTLPAPEGLSGDAAYWRAKAEVLSEELSKAQSKIDHLNREVGRLTEILETRDSTSAGFASES